MNHPRFIYFTGVDGSGKSTIIEKLIKELDSNGVKSRSVWLRFNYFFTRPMLFLCHILGYTRKVKRGDKIIRVHDFHKSKIIASLVQYLHFIDTLNAFLIKVYFPLRFSDDIIFCDKFIYDILVDFMVETKNFNLLDKNITKLYLKLIPKNTPVIFLSADKDEIIKRKPEVLIDDEDYDLKFKAYENIVDKFNLKLINNEDLEDTFWEVKKIISISTFQ